MAPARSQHEKWRGECHQAQFGAGGHLLANSPNSMHLGCGLNYMNYPAYTRNPRRSKLF